MYIKVSRNKKCIGIRNSNTDGNNKRLHHVVSNWVRGPFRNVLTLLYKTQSRGDSKSIKRSVPSICEKVVQTCSREYDGFR